MPAGQNSDVDSDRESNGAVGTNPSPIAKVVMVTNNGFEVVINRGAREGVRVNDRYVVFDVGPELFDPDTGEALGSLEMIRGSGTITQVQEKISVLKSNEVKRVPRPLTPLEKISRQGLAGAVVVGVTQERQQHDYILENAPFSKPTTGDRAKKI